MASEKKLFRETRLYPVVFMLIITIIFIGILATFYQLSLDKVTQYRETQLKKMVLRTFGLPTENIETEFNKFISQQAVEGLSYYEAKSDSVLLGYCFPISGSGLWGTINALLAVTPDFEKIINIEIVDQNETPGLGGRITEKWFKDQFKGKILIDNNIIKSFVLIPENEKGKADEVNQITGATASSKAVVDMIYKNVKKYLPPMRE
ncbi:MAG: FMN-binding protein [Candidatus Cloacimonadales bacterium]|nr:FMN-binding protein [Candidatus Cloacimonadales bacterium]